MEVCIVGQEVHVTSAAIEKLQQQLKQYTRPYIEGIIQMIDGSTEISPLFSIFPPFSVVGVWVEKNYVDQQEFSREILGEKDGALAAVDRLVDGLEMIKRNWRAAEDASTVKYQ